MVTRGQERAFGRVGLLACSVVAVFVLPGCFGRPIQPTIKGVLLWPVARKRLRSKNWFIEVGQPQWSFDGRGVIFAQRVHYSENYTAMSWAPFVGGVWEEARKTEVECIMIYRLDEKKLEPLADGFLPLVVPRRPLVAYAHYVREGGMRRPELWLLNWETGLKRRIADLHYRFKWPGSESYGFEPFPDGTWAVSQSGFKSLLVPLDTSGSPIDLTAKIRMLLTAEGGGPMAPSGMMRWSDRNRDVTWRHHVTQAGEMYIDLHWPSENRKAWYKLDFSDMSLKPTDATLAESLQFWERGRPSSRSPDGRYTLEVRRSKSRTWKRRVLMRREIDNLFLIERDGTEVQLTDFPAKLPDGAERTTEVDSHGAM